MYNTLRDGSASSEMGGSIWTNIFIHHFSILKAYLWKSDAALKALKVQEGLKRVWEQGKESATAAMDGGQESKRSQRAMRGDCWPCGDGSHSKVQNTLSFLMALLDRIESKEIPDDMGEMTTSNKALPESSRVKTNKLDAQGRQRVRDLLTVLEKQMPDEVKK
jgi:hypothetical protein